MMPLIKRLSMIIIHAYEKLGYNDHASILRSGSCEWFVDEYADLDVCGSDVDTDDVMKKPSIYVDTRCREEKIGLHFKIPTAIYYIIHQKHIYLNEMVAVPTTYKSLIPFMKRLYDAIADVSAIELPGLNMREFLDHSLLQENHCLGLPGFCKFNGLGDSSCVSRIVFQSHNVMHSLSCIPLDMIPRNLWLEIPSSWVDDYVQEKIDRNSYHCDEDEDMEDDFHIWEMVIQSVPEAVGEFIGVRRKQNGGKLVMKLVPIKMPCKCPVYLTEHDNNIPFITRRGYDYQLECWQWWRVHKYDNNAQYKGPVLIYSLEGREASLTNRRILYARECMNALVSHISLHRKVVVLYTRIILFALMMGWSSISMIVAISTIAAKWALERLPWYLTISRPTMNHV